MTTPIIEKLYFSPVKSLSFSYSPKLIVKKNIGITNDRIFAFTRLINRSKADNYEKNPKDRNLNFFLTLKNSPFLNKYNFELKEKELSLLLNNKLINQSKKTHLFRCVFLFLRTTVILIQYDC